METATQAQVIGRRYRVLNQLGSGGMGQLYRVVDRLTGRTLALKRVTRPGNPTDFDTPSDVSPLHRVALAQEFRMLASLHHPHVISVLDYGFDSSGAPFFTMELQEGAQPILQAGQNQPIGVKVSFLVQLLQALEYVHRRGIVHRDLKPANVLVKDGQVKVLDFGLSITQDQKSDTIAGTLAYMAPEVVQGETAAAISDLYSVGVIAYELFSGDFLYSAERVGELVDQILNTEPDFSDLKLSNPMAEVIRRLLDKKPASRFPSAEAAIHALRQAFEQPLPKETPFIRESFLQAANLVGRENELAQLSEALQHLLAGRGSAWMVGGESGVGKSRLLEELRILSLVRGPLVLSGGAVREGGHPYEIWRDLVRWLAILSELSDLEAGTLAPLIPDITTLINKDVPEAPELDPESGQARLLTVIGNLLLRLKSPVVLILEDLHWAGTNSLAVLRQILRLTTLAPILIIGSYRDDERPDLPKQLPGTNILKLNRLQEDEIAKLSEVMLGPVGRQSEVLELLRRETEGNPFFLVEVIRALAQEAGELSKIGTKFLPMQVFTGGMQQIIQARLSRIPERSREMLHYAAAIGRYLDLDLLFGIEGEVDWQEWLTICSNAAILELVEGRWRFTHDKLRDALLDEIKPDRRPGLHTSIGMAMESVYPHSMPAALAHHWRLGGNNTKEGFYAALAGEEALQNGAYKEAIELITRATSLKDEFKPSALDLAHLERLLGDAHFGQGHMKEANAHLRRSLATLGRPMPAASTGLVISLLGQVLRQLLHRLWPARFVGTGEEERAELLEATRNYEQLLEISHFENETVVSLYSGVRSLNLAEVAGPDSPELVSAYANMCYATGLVPLRRLAETYRLRARDTGRNVDDPSALGWALLLSGYYLTGIGRWQESRHEMERAIAIHDRMGNLRRLGICQAVKSYSHYFRGEFERGAELYVDLYKASQQRGDLVQQAWALDGQAMHILRLGKMDQALALLKVADPFFDEITDRVEEILHHGLMALSYLRLDQSESAIERAARVEALLEGYQPSAPYILDGYSSVVEIYLSLWESSSTPELRKSMASKARKALKAMSAQARVFPVCEPRFLLWKGVESWNSNRRSKARKIWAESLKQSEALKMPYEQALAHYEIGRHEGSRGSNQHLQTACELFQGVGASYDWAYADLSLKAKAAGEIAA